MSKWITKDSGVRAAYASGMVRDSQDGKAFFDLLLAEGIPYEEQFLTRVAELMTRGVVKYGSRNWERANSVEEMNRFRGSALRHLVQWYCGAADEDHASAVVFNLLAAEMTQYKINRDGETWTLKRRSLRVTASQFFSHYRASRRSIKARLRGR